MDRQYLAKKTCSYGRRRGDL